MLIGWNAVRFLAECGLQARASFRPN